MYSKITNPKTGRKISIKSRLGKSILRNYLFILSGGAAKSSAATKSSAPKGIHHSSKQSCADILKLQTSKFSQQAIDKIKILKRFYSDKCLCGCPKNCKTFPKFINSAWAENIIRSYKQNFLTYSDGTKVLTTHAITDLFTSFNAAKQNSALQQKVSWVPSTGWTPTVSSDAKSQYIADILWYLYPIPRKLLRLLDSSTKTKANSINHPSRINNRITRLQDLLTKIEDIITLRELWETECLNYSVSSIKNYKKNRPNSIDQATIRSRKDEDVVIQKIVNHNVYLEDIKIAKRKTSNILADYQREFDEIKREQERKKQARLAGAMAEENAKVRKETQDVEQRKQQEKLEKRRVAKELQKQRESETTEERKMRWGGDMNLLSLPELEKIIKRGEGISINRLSLKDVRGHLKPKQQKKLYLGNIARQIQLNRKIQEQRQQRQQREQQQREQQQYQLQQRQLLLQSQLGHFNTEAINLKQQLDAVNKNIEQIRHLQPYSMEQYDQIRQQVQYWHSLRHSLRQRLTEVKGMIYQIIQQIEVLREAGLVDEGDHVAAAAAAASSGGGGGGGGGGGYYASVTPTSAGQKVVPRKTRKKLTITTPDGNPVKLT